MGDRDMGAYMGRLYGKRGGQYMVRVREILGEEGEGEEWLRELEKLRENGGVNEIMNGCES